MVALTGLTKAEDWRFNGLFRCRHELSIGGASAGLVDINEKVVLDWPATREYQSCIDKRKIYYLNQYIIKTALAVVSDCALTYCYKYQT